MATGVIAATVVTLVLAGTIGGAGAADGVKGERPQQRAPALATCFWEGPISMKRPTTRGFDGHYFNFPEESATYWMSRFELPEGARLLLRGRYPHGRYMSLNSYSEGAPTDALSDIVIRPDLGSTNPFIAGHRRDRKRRAWRVTVVDRTPPAPGSPRAPNTLYARPGGDVAIEVFYRVYEADRGLGLTGGTALPRPILRLEGGKVIRGKAACAEINDPNRDIPVESTPEVQWETARKAPGCDPETNPAYDPPRWERFFTFEFAALGVIVDCTDAGREARQSQTPEVKGGNYSNKDSAYIYSHLNRKFGEVLVVTGKLPITPRTFRGQKRMGRAQMRFWSLCSGESRVTTYTPDCLADRQVPLRKGRRYTIVVSRASDRPANARRACGVAWLDRGKRGDGAGDRDYGFLILRNMLVSKKFRHSIQKVLKAGTEAQVMGRYFPRSAYATRKSFEARGCAGAPSR